MKAVTPALTLTLSLLVGGGCAVGPDYVTPELATPAAFSPIPGARALAVEHWAGLYQDPELDQLIDRARANNHSLAALYQRTLQARALIRREQSEKRLQATGSAAYRRSENPSQGGIPRDRNEHQAFLDLGWELDLFGRVARLIEAAEAEAEATGAAFEDLLLLTETEAAIAYFQIRALDREIDAIERSTQTRQEALKIVKQRFESGLVSDLDVAQAETLLAESEAEVSVLRRQREVLEHALAVLTGEPAPVFSIAPGPLNGFSVAPPHTLPSRLLQSRPDLQEAELRLQRANAEVGVASANFYPRISIGGTGGFAAVAADDWFRSNARFYSIGPEITLPIFQGGRLRAELSRTEAAYAETLENYRQAVLVAFAEVEDALSGWRHLAAQREARDRAAASASRAQKLSEQQYRNGSIDFITALDAERVALDAERRLAQVIGEEYVNSVRLIRAIGGRWE